MNAYTERFDDCEVVVYDARVERCRDWHPYGSTFVSHDTYEVIVDADIVFPISVPIADMVEVLSQKVRIGTDAATLRPAPYSAVVRRVDGNRVVLSAEWYAEP